MKRTALITGITGQDGSYLAELLLSKGYEVHGMVRRVAAESPEHRLTRIRYLLPKLHLHAASLESYASLTKMLQDVQPDECYHLAGQSYVSYSFDDEFSTMRTNIQGTHELLAALKQVVPACKFYFAGSSEMFGKVHASPQNEETPFHPRSTYAISKVSGFYLSQYYREAYGTFACTGILFNHESPRRGLEFVTRKITSHVVKIKLGLAQELRLGNLDAKRDWGHAREYVEAMWRMLQQSQPGDYVIATGETHSVREFCEVAFGYVGLDYREWVRVDPALFRPADVEVLVGDASKARRDLQWKNQILWKDLIVEMVEADLERAQREAHIAGRLELVS
ncbi:MAG: GDP-mannose 4,6-dehydratase [Terriglobales bacterium]